MVGRTVNSNSALKLINVARIHMKLVHSETHEVNVYKGESERSIGFHAGIRDTSELLAVYPEGVRRDMIRPRGGLYLEDGGFSGNPGRASARLGRALLNLKIHAALSQIRAMRESNESAIVTGALGDHFHTAKRRPIP